MALVSIFRTNLKAPFQTEFFQTSHNWETEETLAAWNATEIERDRETVWRFWIGDRLILEILAERVSEATAELDKLVKKAQRYGSPDIRWSLFEGPFSRKEKITGWDGEVRTVTRHYQRIEVTGEAPRVGNYEFLARIEFTEGGNLLDLRPGVEGMEPRFRDTDCSCEHCGKKRSRKEVFVVREIETGNQMQVGRSCLRDFLGIDDPAKVAFRFGFWREAAEMGDDWSRGGGIEFCESLEGSLALASVCIRLFGWCSKGQAAKDERLTPTIDYVMDVLQPPKSPTKEETARIKKIEASVSPEDYEAARATIQWVRDQVDNVENEYIHNLVVLFSADNITSGRRMGLAISAVAAKARADGEVLRRTKEFEKKKLSNFVGKEGERIRDLEVTQTDSRVVSGGQFGDCVLVKFEDNQGNILSWFTGRGTDRRNGEKMTITGTVKRHQEYKGVKETQLSRVKISALIIPMGSDNPAAPIPF